MQIEIESITPDKTRAFFREVGGDTYWEIETITSPSRIFYSIRQDGWHVAEMSCRDFVDGWECRWVSGKRRVDSIPAEVMSHLPKAQ